VCEDIKKKRRPKKHWYEWEEDLARDSFRMIQYEKAIFGFLSEYKRRHDDINLTVCILSQNCFRVVASTFAVTLTYQSTYGSFFVPGLSEEIRASQSGEPESKPA
jgi:hypothetical protein